MTVSVLSLVQRYCREYALPVPTSLQGSADAGSQQYRSLLNTVGEYIHDKCFWENTKRTAAWTSTAGADQGKFSTRCPDMDYAEQATFWDFTLRKPVFGPLTDADWQAYQAFLPGGPLYQYRIAADRIEVNPAMPVGHSLSIMFKSLNWVCLNGSPLSATKQTFTLDDDTCIFADKLMLQGLRAYWLRIKQMPYRLEDDKFEDMLERAASRDSVKPTVFMDQPRQSLRPGIWVPAGNWPVSGGGGP